MDLLKASWLQFLWNFDLWDFSTQSDVGGGDGMIQGDPVVANSLVRDLKRVGKVTLNCYSSSEWVSTAVFPFGQRLLSDRSIMSRSQVWAHNLSSNATVFVGSTGTTFELYNLSGKLWSQHINAGAYQWGLKRGQKVKCFELLMLLSQIESKASVRPAYDEISMCIRVCFGRYGMNSTGIDAPEGCVCSERSEVRRRGISRATHRGPAGLSESAGGFLFEHVYCSLVQNPTDQIILAVMTEP